MNRFADISVSQSSYMGIAETIVIEYNNKNKHRLSLRQLYGKAARRALETEE